jgi:hypothetical protein
LCTAGHSTAQTLICFSALLLFLSLYRPRLPVVSDRPFGIFQEVFQDIILIHELSLSGSSSFFHRPMIEFSRAVQHILWIELLEFILRALLA